MKIRRTFVGSGGVQHAHVPRLISEAFGCSEGEANRLLQAERVTLDGEPFFRKDAPVSELAGRRLSVDSEGVDLEA